jgi:hypothetical protein
MRRSRSANKPASVQTACTTTITRRDKSTQPQSCGACLVCACVVCVYLDIGTRKLVLCHDKLFQIDILGKSHATGVDLEDLSLGLDVGQRELDLAVDTTGTDQRRIQGLDTIGGHQHLDIATRIEAIELVQELEHCALDFTFAT